MVAESVMPPLVSVIIPTYNRWPMVGEAVDSVLCQTHRSFEVVVVDDGSTDETVIALTGRDRRVHLVSQPNRGVAAARNAGARHARGKYLAFLDSDDLWLPGKLELQTAFMQGNAGEVCQTEEIWVRRGVRVNPKNKHRKPSGDIFRRSLDLCVVSPSAVMMSKGFFQRIGGFDENFPVCEDYELWLRVTAAQPVPLIQVPLVVKRGGHADQLSHSMWGMDRFRIAAIQKLLRTGLDQEKQQWGVEALKRKIAIVAEGARKRGRESEAKGYDAMLSEFCEESIGHVRRSDSRIREGQRISPAYH